MDFATTGISWILQCIIPIPKTSALTKKTISQTGAVGERHPPVITAALTEPGRTIIGGIRIINKLLESMTIFMVDHIRHLIGSRTTTACRKKVDTRIIPVGIPGERDTYYHANVIHDLAKSIHSGLTGADYVMPAKVNIGSEDSYWPCNAYWDYTGINLFSAGGGCAATDQMADVIYHEYGHGLAQFIYDPY